MTRGLGAPDVQLGVLSIWVHGYQYPDAGDECDGNWLRVTARCAATGATVEVSGAILDTVGFQTFQRQVAAIHATLQGKAVLGSAEPDLSVEVHAVGHTGQLEAAIDITPEHLRQVHGSWWLSISPTCLRSSLVANACLLGFRFEARGPAVPNQRLQPTALGAMLSAPRLKRRR